MSGLAPFVVSGLVSGSVYGLASTGLVLTYKTSGLLNLGHGALATAAAYVFYALHVDAGVDWRLSIAISVFGVGSLMGLGMERLARRLATQRTALKVVGTVGLILVVQGLGTIKYGVDRLTVPQYLPNGDDVVRLAGVNIRYSQVTVASVGVVAAAALFVLLRRSRLGVSMRALVDDPDLVELDGTSATRVRRTSWVIGSMFAALSGVLVVPFIGLEPIVLTFLVVQAFGAAAIGSFSSIPLTFAGGLLVGVGEAVLTKYEIEYPSSLGISRALPFVILIVAMLLFSRGRRSLPSTLEPPRSLEWRGPPALRHSALACTFCFLCSVPLWADGELAPYWISALAVTLLMLSLGLLVRAAGLVSLCSAGFAAIGAVAFSQLHVDADVPWIGAVVLAGVVAVPLGAVVALPSLRLSGLFLALATLSFGLLLERVFYRRSFFFSALAQGRHTPRPSWASSDGGYYLLVLAFVIVAVGAFMVIDRSRLGRMVVGLGDSPRAMSTLGLDVTLTRVIVFSIGAYVAAVAGALHSGILGVAGAESHFYTSFHSVTLLAVLALAPFRSPWFAIFAGLTQVIPAYIDGSDTPHVLTVLFGVSAIAVAARGGAPGMPDGLQRAIESRFRSTEVARHRRAKSAPDRTVKPTSRDPAAIPDGLRVQNVSVRFGGHVAVDKASLTVPLGRITGLIGPNGAGKSTVLNVCSGLVRPSAGRVILHGEDVTRRSPSGRARRGLGRTFQVADLCESLTVADNVAIGREAGQVGGRVTRHFIAPSSESALLLAAADEALALCGITQLAGRQAGELSTGQRRLVELARCLAGPFDVLLLDEPTSGLDRAESDRFCDVLRCVVDDRGCGVLLVEHDMSIVTQLCTHVYVVDFGTVIFDGSPAGAVADSRVRAAYLGPSDAVRGPQA